MRSVVVSMLPPAHAAANASRLPNSTRLRTDQFLFSRARLSTEPQVRRCIMLFDVSVPTLYHQP